MAFREVTKLEPCPICLKPDWCRRDIETGMIECHRVEEGSIQTTRGGFFIHRLDIDGPRELSIRTTAPSYKTHNKADIDDLHKVYSYFLSILTLSKKHNQDLRERGIPSEIIADLGYRSMPIQNRRQVSLQLKNQFSVEILRKVPGFSITDSSDIKILGAPGILLPCRDIMGRIQGFQVRHDDAEVEDQEEATQSSKYRWLSSQECSTGSPVHVTHNKQDSILEEKVWITEGILKADIAAYKLDARVIGVAGVNAWMNQEDILTDLFKDIKTVIIAFDADADENLQVDKAITDLSIFLEKITTVEIAQWDSKLGKGIDDLLVAGNEPKLYPLSKAPDIVERKLNKVEDLSDKEKIAAIPSILEKIAASSPTQQGYYLDLMKKAGLGSMSDLRAELKISERIQREEAYEKHAEKISETQENQEEVSSEVSVTQEIVFRTYMIEGSSIDNRPLNEVSKDINDALINRQKEVLYRNPDNTGMLQVDNVNISASIVGEQDFGSLAREVIMTRIHKTFKIQDNTFIKNIADPYIPDYIIRHIFHHKNLLSEHPVLRGVVNHPILTKNGIISKNGYHEDSEYLLKQSPEIDFDKLDTSEEAIKEAKRWILDEMLGEVLFESKEDRMNYLAYLLTFAIRPAIQGNVPLFIVDAPVAGSGKTFALQIAHLLWTDKTKTATPIEDNRQNHGEEMRKKLTSILRTNPESVIFDNVDISLNSSSLAMALTAESFHDRELGKNTMIEVEVRAIIAMTGNNIIIERDIPRRVYICRITADREKPDFRKFVRPDLANWIREHREILIKSCITLIKAWIDKGKQLNTDINWGSYNEWAQTIGGIFNAIGIEGFLQNRDNIEGEDTLAMRTFCRTVYEEFEETQFTSDDIFSIASYHDDNEEAGQNILGEWLGIGREHSRKIRLGKLLSKNADRYFEDLRLIKLDKRAVGNKTQYQLQKSDTIGEISSISEEKNIFDFEFTNEEKETSDQGVEEQLSSEESVELNEEQQRELDRIIMSLLAESGGSMNNFALLDKLHEEGYKISLTQMQTQLQPFLDEGHVIFNGDSYKVL